MSREMELGFTKDEDEFRTQVRAWLTDHVPTEPRPPVTDLSACRIYDLAWQAEMYKAGWAGISWPTEYGGKGLPLTKQLIWYEEYAQAKAPPIGSESVCFVGLAHAGPTLMYCGTEDQKSTHLPSILKGETVWCQGFSEPSAGSDLASLSTKAVIDGDEFVVNGQKVWTSYADQANFQELLVRTDPEAPKHKGITWMICDMSTPGITVRPIENMAGAREFCEVYYDDVRIPIANVVGEINDGWRVAMSTLAFERGTAFAADQVNLANRVEDLIELANRTDIAPNRRAIDDDAIKGRLAIIRAEVISLKAMTYMSVSRNMRQDLPGPEGSIVRLFYSKLCQRVGRLAMDILGSSGLDRNDADAEWSSYYLFNFAATIGAGTEQIQRNIIGERFLGLPRG